MSDSLKELTETVRVFVDERDWGAFQSPKNLALALCGEAGELAEQLQWLTQEQSRNPEPDRRQRIADECADVLVYLVRIADELGFDLVEAAKAKCLKNEKKYPVELVHGRLKRRDEYER
ncbi:MazG-like family protein [Pseudodesulfovibrio senegalensis]|jgi:NTP pyrophosphatase (non-canonical NTP hydrolase)|uniref:Nucleotide pyrophosphohydrolase n=1 Tax=Pseudodesulfovibrio senegalensis TaxID=1721087 RepID=A0A6N6N057_9BACT|nr:nucleotide pyrophosphohydrolase [Pseudodesulfovibrio senegalensis]KAB1437251.1 nucleotide pyrophosphohydrolase [Pseudodesulfovibrio senegalensis]